MEKRRAIIVLLLVMCHAVSTFGWYYDGEGEHGDDHTFIMQGRKEVVKTEAGVMSIVKGGGFRTRMNDKPVHVGFITMEPKSLFIPQYLDSDLILFVRIGESRVGLICKDELVEIRLRHGDVYRIPAGTPFYLVNTCEDQRLHIICSIDRSDSLAWGSIQSFFIAGGTYPISVLAGFDPQTLSTAFNVSTSELFKVLSSQQQGPIVFLPNSNSPSLWTKFLELEHHQREHYLKMMLQFHGREVEEDEEEEDTIWSFRKLLSSMFGSDDNGKLIGNKAPSSYNIYDRKPDYRNNYGWSLALDHKEYKPLSRSDIGIYLVNLTKGSMMAPHINPTATEYGIVLRGSGRIQVVYPNGTLAMNANVKEGDVFWIPRYFPFCQIASKSGPFVFFGFTTSASKNRPQFLIGKNSVLKTMRSPEFAAGFGVSEKRLKRILNAQRESTILPSAELAPPKREEEVGKMMIEKVAKVITSYGDGF